MYRLDDIWDIIILDLDCDVLRVLPREISPNQGPMNLVDLFPVLDL